MSLTIDPYVLETGQKLTRYFFTEIERPTVQLIRQLEDAQVRLVSLVTTPLEGHQLVAVLCLFSDVSQDQGLGKSLFVRALNDRMFQIAAGEFHAFCTVSGRINVRAWNKRKAEHHLFVNGQLLFD